MGKVDEKREVGPSHADPSGQGKGSKSISVVTVPPGNDPPSLGLAGFQKILPRKLDGCLNRF